MIKIKFPYRPLFTNGIPIFLTDTSCILISILKTILIGIDLCLLRTECELKNITSEFRLMFIDSNSVNNFDDIAGVNGVGSGIQLATIQFVPVLSVEEV